MRPAKITYHDGLIVAIDPAGPADHDFGDAVVMAGLVDAHVHVNEPGRTHWEGFETATRAAAAGGTTTIVDMPLNSIPPTTTVGALEEKRSAARGRIAVDVAFWGGLIPGSLDQLPSLAAEGVSGFKAFLVDSGVPEFPPVPGAVLEVGLASLSELGVPALIHAEALDLLGEPEGDPTAYATYLATRPPESEARAIASMAHLADSTGAAVHILHVSSGDGARAIASADAGLTGETCPHYLTFAAENIPDRATVFKCAPPIRHAEHREALWEALGNGSLQMVVSDHSPAPADMKEVESGDFIRAWGGISSLQLRLPAVWDGGSQRGFGLNDMSRWLAEAPAALAGLKDRKGAIKVGADADFVIWDPDDLTRVVGSRLEHRHPLTPYHGMALRGRVLATVLGGTIVHGGGAGGRRHGRMLRRT